MMSMANVRVRRWTRRSGYSAALLLITGLTGCAGLRPSTPATLDDGVPGYSIQQALALGALVAVTYDVFDNSEGNPNPPFPQDYPDRFEVIGNLQGQDIRGRSPREFYGHVARIEDDPSTLVVAIRGTSDRHEWIDDAKFFFTPYPPDPDAGKVEQGFDEIFRSFTVAEPGMAEPIGLSAYLVSKAPVSRLIVTGHSLGSSLATLVAFEAGRLGWAEQVENLTFASPRTGNGKFVRSFNAAVPRSYRLVNNPDVVPKVPPFLFGYRHVDGQLTLNSRGNPDIRNNLGCFHSLQTYLHLLDPSIALEPQCVVEE